MPEFYYDDPGDDTKRLGQRIYEKALSGRRGFRPDQVGIETDDNVWLEIFEAIGVAAKEPKSEA